jgi:hypothetical protein
MLKREDFIFVTDKLWMSLPEEFRSRYINVDSHRTFLPPAGVLQAIASGIFTPYQPRRRASSTYQRSGEDRALSKNIEAVVRARR